MDLVEGFFFVFCFFAKVGAIWNDWLVGWMGWNGMDFI